MSLPGPNQTAIKTILQLRRNGPLPVFSELHAAYGPLVRLKMPRREMILVGSVDLAQEVLVKHNRTFLKPTVDDRLDSLSLVLGDGLLTNPDHESWLSQRRMMQPMFHRQHIATMGAQMVEAGQRMLTRWEGCDEIAILEEMMIVTLDIINRTMFSVDIMDEAAEMGAAVENALHYVAARNRSPLTIPPEWPLPRNVAFQKALETLDSRYYTLIRERRASGSQQGDLLDMLIAARDADTGHGMTDEQIRDEVATIFGAGHETTANALSWTWYLLNQNPQALTRMQEEADSVLGGRAPTMADLHHMPYTLAVLKEAMRVYPPVPLIPRLAVEETQIGDYVIPQGTFLLVVVNELHHSPTEWNTPEEFRPERFLTEERHRAYMPFGAGPRMCIGNNFALMEGHILLALMAQHVELDTLRDDAPSREVNITMRPGGGLPARVRWRERTMSSV